MEQWESLVKSYPSSASQGDFRKAVNSAGIVLKEDLAPFEIEWTLQTLLTKPVYLLTYLSQHANDNNWTSVIGLAFDMLSAIFTNHASCLQQYVDDIVKVCLLNYTALNRRRALNTLYAACKNNVWSQHWATIVNTAGYSLVSDDAVIVRAARAKLIGAICEHHPDTLSDGQEIKLWRTFLSALEGSKVTDSLINGILHGIFGLFKNFGMNLPIVEISGILYERLAKQYIAIGSCEEICLQILSSHSNLFPERLSADVSLRGILWTLLGHNCAAQALIAVYKVAVNDATVQDIVTTEIYPRIYSKNPQERSMACRILADILKKYTNQTREIWREFEKKASNICTELDFSLNMKVDTLQEKNEYDHDLMNLLEEASWCIETNVPGCDSLLRSVLILHNTIPSNRKKKLLVHVLLNADPFLRTAAITFLLSESIQNEQAMHKYYSIWEQIFHTNLDSDAVVERNRPSVVEDIVNYLLKMLNASLSEVTSEKSTQKLSDLLKLTSNLLSMENFSCHLPNGCAAAILDLIMDLAKIHGASEGLVLMAAALIRLARSCDDEVDLRAVEFICNINQNSSEALRCAFCLATLEIPSEYFFKGDGDVNVLLDALQVILTRSDVESEMMNRAVLKLDEIISSKQVFSIDSQIEEIAIRLVERVKEKKIFNGKAGRILEINIVLFLGKHGNRARAVQNNNYSDNVISLRELLFLSIPNLSDGTNFKLNISRVHDLALQQEDPEVLNVLLSIISAYLANKTEPLLQQALTGVIIKLSYCHSRMEGGRVDSLLSAVMLCDKGGCVAELFEHITRESAPGPRKIMSNLLSHLLTLEPHSEDTESAIRQLFEKTIVLIKSGPPKQKNSALDFVESLLDCVKQNNELYKELIPDLFTAILASRVADALRILSETFLEKILIFDQEVLKRMSKEISEFLKADEDNSVDLLKVTLLVLKGIYGALDLNYKALIETLDRKPSSKLFKILKEAKDVFEFDAEKCRYVINCIEEGSLKCNLCDFKSTDSLKSVFVFVTCYAGILIELRYQETLTFLGESIQQMSPKQVKYLKGDLKNCIEAIKQTNGQTPQILTKYIENWILKVAFEDLTRSLKMEYITSKDELNIGGLLKMLRFLNKDRLKSIPADCFDEWMEILLKLHIDESAILKSKMAVMTDVLAVTLLFLKPSVVVELCRNSLSFVKYFIAPFSFNLMDHVFVHLDSETVNILLNCILSYYSRERCSKEDGSRILGCIVELWPRLEKDLTFEELNLVLVKLTKINDLTIDTECPPVNWWVKEMAESEKDRKIKLIQVLPLFLQGGSEEYRNIFNAPLSTLPAMLPPRGPPAPAPASALAALAALAACAHPLLARHALAASGAEDLSPWLEASFEQCITSLAMKQDGAVLKMIYDICSEDDLSVCLMERALGPMIRYLNHETCQEFFANVMPKVLATLWKKTRACASVAYSIYMVQCARAFTLVKWCFEKMSLQTLESTESPIYSKIELKRSKNLAQEICKLCVTLRSEVKIGAGGEQMKKCFRYFQTSNYNCLAAVLLKTKPRLEFFDHLFKTETWGLLVDSEKKYIIYIEGLGRSQLKRHQVTSSGVTSSGVTSSGVTSYGGHSTSAATFTRRTLSDNPFMYDMMDDFEDVQCETQAILLSDNELNGHPCSTAVCSVIRHLSTAEQGSAGSWLTLIVKAIRECCANVKWFLAQAIINCKEVLKAHNSVLAPALLALVADTPYKHEDKCFLNGLHVNILNTIHYWNSENSIENDAAFPYEDKIRTIVQLLLNTCIHHKQRSSVLKALTQCLANLVQMYGEFIKIDMCYFEEILKDQSKEAACYEILETVTKNKLYVPELIPVLLTRLQGQTERQTNVAKLLGLALSSCHDVAVKMTALSKLYKYLDRLRGSNSQDYVKVLFYVQNGCMDVCNQINFRHITDLAPKMVREQRTKCLNIISNFISRYTECDEYITAMFDTIDICDAIISDDTHAAMRIAECGLALMSDTLRRRVVHLVCSYCDSSSVSTRKSAYAVVLKAAEEFLTENGETSAKRQKTEPTSKILNLLRSEDVYKNTVLGNIGFGMIDKQADIRTFVFDKLCPMLEVRDMPVRFLESVLICVYLPSMMESKSKKIEASKCLTSVMKLYLNGYISQDGFERIKLREEPLNIRINLLDAGSSKLLTMSRTVQGTLRTNLTRGSSKRSYKAVANAESSLDVQLPLRNIINTFLDFCQNNKEASTSFFLETIKQLQRYKEINVSLAKLFCTVMSKCMTDLTPCVVEASRLCVDECSAEAGFKPILERMLRATRRTEGYELTRLLYEDVLLRNVYENYFVLGNWNKEDFDIEMEETSKKFSVEEMLSCFDKLSNWDELTIQKRKEVKNSGLPVLWTDEQTFRQALAETADIPYWLSKMRSAYEQVDISSGEQYMELKSLDTWPRNHFVLSCMTEIVQWQSLEEAADWSKLPCDIRPADCLAEWAARLMARSCLAKEMEKDEMTGCDVHLRSQQLLWCSEARARGLSCLVPPCVKLCIPNLTENEIRPWLYQQCLMLQSQGLDTGDQELLKKALEKLENISPNFGSASDKVLLSELCLKLQLHKTLNTLTKDIIKSNTKDLFDEIHLRRQSENNTKNIVTIQEMCMDYLNDDWENHTDLCNQNEVLSAMVSCLNQMNKLSVRSDFAIFTLLYRLDQYAMRLPDSLSDEILKVLSPLIEHFDDITIDQIVSIKHKFKPEILGKHKIIQSIMEKGQISLMQRCLELVCDAGYALMQYCEGLTRALNLSDEAQWETTFQNMKSLMYENECAGASYHLLAKYKSDLYQIGTFESSEEFKTKSISILKRIYLELQRLPPKTTLNMADVCLSLSRPLSERDGKSLARILKLDPGVYVVKFEKHVQIFTNSLRRPCVVRALLSTGHTRRFIIKRGEPLRVDAAAARAVRTLNNYSAFRCKEYRVTPISDDCGVIEYLESHVTLRSMVSKDYKLDEVLSLASRLADAPPAPPRAASLTLFDELCGKVPAHALRSAIENSSASVEDFILKKKNFQEGLAVMAVYHWLLGLGDRHLENLMLSLSTGAPVSVDLSSILQHGAGTAPEPPPARLTRLLTAVCHTAVLESRMQSILKSLRESRKMVCLLLRSGFRWMPDYGTESFETKMTYIQELLQGRALSFHITKRSLNESNVKYKENYCALLDEVFSEFPTKEFYGVEEQISSLLLQSSDRRILSVTRKGWEPWL